MIKANEVREIRANEVKRLAEEKTKKHEEWLNGEVTEKIKSVAKDPSCCVTVTKPTNLDSKMVAKMLELNGYNVVVRNGLIDISW